MAGKLDRLGHNDIEVQGLEEVLDTFKNLLPREAKNLARSTVHAIALKMRNEMRMFAPFETGTLRKAIVAVRRRGTPESVESDVMATHGGGQQHDAFYWRFKEYGTIKETPTPFVSPIVEGNRPKIPALYRELFGKKLEQSLARKAKKALKAKNK